MANIKENNQGIAAIITVIIVGAVALIFTRGIGLMGLDELDAMSACLAGEQARAAAESCLDEGLRRLELDNDFSADEENIALPQGSCRLSVSGTGSSRIIAADASYEASYRRYEAIVELLSDRLEISNIEEIVN
jgi:hypothetical protein